MSKKLISIRKPKMRLTSKGVKFTAPSARVGGAAGVNISKSGASASVRTKHGTASTRKGCSVRAGAFVGFLLLLASLMVVGRGAAYAAPAEPTEPTPPPGQDAVVTRIVDGDTIEVRIAGRKYTVRYIGVDTPETVKPNTPVQCFGKEASAYNRKLVYGKTVRLVKDISESDRYGRLLRYVYLSNGRMVNEELLKGGYALVSTYPPDVAHVDQFLELQREAREASAGLWGRCVAVEASAPVEAPAEAPAPNAAAPCDCNGPDLDCKDFMTQAAAQSCWEYCGGKAGGKNPHRLDGSDKDGRVCETLP